jgi:hypothetical protein
MQVASEMDLVEYTESGDHISKEYRGLIIDAACLAIDQQVLINISTIRKIDIPFLFNVLIEGNMMYENSEPEMTKSTTGLKRGTK